MNSRVVHILIPVLIFVVSFLVYSPSLKNSFVWDDQILIERSYKKLENVNFYRSFFPKAKKVNKTSYYRPIIRSSLTADYLVWNKNSFGYHLTNNLFFSLTALAFYFLALLILGQFRKRISPVLPAVVASLVFTFHPMHVESVAWISGRTDLICSFFLVMALIAHTQFSKNIFIILAPIFFILSLMSKEVAVTFPFIVVFYDILARRYERRSVILITIYFLILALYIFMRTRSFVNITAIDINLGSSASSLHSKHSNLFIYLESIKILICSLGIYIEKLLAPLSFNVYIPEVSTKPINLISSIILTIATAVIFIISLMKKHHILSFSVFVTLITLAPSLLLSIMPIAATPVAERYLFIPSIGYSLLAGLVFIELNKRIVLRFSLILLILLLTIFLYLNVSRQPVWKDRLSLWYETSKNSAYAFPHSNYALALADSGNYEKAIDAYAVALSPKIIDSDHGRAITTNNLALLYIKQGRYQEAEIVLHEALKLNPNYSRTFYNLGLINYIKGEVTNSKRAYESALTYVNKASKFYKRNPKLKLLKGKILINLGKSESAIKEIKSAIKIGLEGELLKEANAIMKVYENSRKNKPNNDTK